MFSPGTRYNAGRHQSVQNVDHLTSNLASLALSFDIFHLKVYTWIKRTENFKNYEANATKLKFARMSVFMHVTNCIFIVFM